MSALRDEIAALKIQCPSHQSNSYGTWALAVEATLGVVCGIVDKHEAKLENRVEKLAKIAESYKAQLLAEMDESAKQFAAYLNPDKAPSEDRPVRTRLRLWASDARNQDEVTYFAAIVEAIDALGDKIENALVPK